VIRLRAARALLLAPLLAGASRALLLAPLLAGAARAADAPLDYLLEARGGRLVARLDLRPAFPEDLRRTLGNGLTNVVTLQILLLPERGEEPLGLYGRELDVRFDVWEETFAVTVKDPLSPRGRRLTARSWEELRALLGDARDLDLAPLAALGGAGWVLAARVDVNPVSKELLERTREFIANPPTGVRGAAPSRSVLGAMASYLLHGGEGGEARTYRTRPFTLREVRRP
jgi:hypothetical protein